MTIQLIVNGHVIIGPFIKNTIKNSYSARKYSTNRVDELNSSDFTINSFLYDPIAKKFHWHSSAKDDAQNKLIKAVNLPEQKIIENRLFLLDAGILLSILGSDWSVDFDTYKAITDHALEISVVAVETIRDRLSYLMRYSQKPSLAFRFFLNTGILDELLPQLTRGVGLLQSNKANGLDLFSHIMLALDSIDPDEPNAEALRWACVFHDIAKPYTKSYDKRGNVHFYGHDKIGAIFAGRWLETYKFDKDLIVKVVTLCKYHLFEANPKLEKPAVIRLIKRVGTEHILDLLRLREADRKGTGRPDISMRKVEILRRKIQKILQSSQS